MRPTSRTVSNYSGGIFDIATKRDSLAEIETKMSDASFWDDKEAAQKTVAQLSLVKSVAEPFAAIERQVEDFAVLAELIAEEGAESDMMPEAEPTLARIEAGMSSLELVSFLGGRFDKGNAIITLHAGSGGTESCDWADMLLRMYTRWIERRGFQHRILEVTEGEVAGIKSATLMVEGQYAYGYLQAERGVHRLVRISPFDSNKRRHTSFAALEVSPDIEDDIDVEIDEKDLRVDTFRASGAGGQHVNTTDSAVRLTHLPTGVVVACQNERSQHQNRATAMKILRSKLYERQASEIEEQRQAEAGPKGENAWGSQIRSYVLHPYQMVKDVRSNTETSNTAAVLDGDLDMFIEAYLRLKKQDASG